MKIRKTRKVIPEDVVSSCELQRFISAVQRLRVVLRGSFKCFLPVE